MGRKQHYTVVVDFSRGSIKMAAAQSACDAVRFRGITMISVPRDTDDEKEIAAHIRREVNRHGWTGMRSSCLLSRSATSTQSFLFPPMPDKELRQAIALKLRETLHFDLEEASFDFRRVRTYGADAEERVLTLVAAARKDEIRRAVSILREAGLKPVAIGAAAESLANLALGANLCKEDEATIHVDIGSGSTILNMFDGRVLRFSREIETAGDSFTQALMRPIIGPEGALRLTHEQAEEIKILAGCPSENEVIQLPHGVDSSDIAPLMEPVVQRLSAEIRRSIDYLGGLIGRSDVDRIVLSGPAGNMRNLGALLAESLDTPVEFIDPVERSIAHWRLAICDKDAPPLRGYAAILGYSLGGDQPINLLPRDERIEQVVQRAARVRKTTAAPALALSAILAVAAVPIEGNYRRADEGMRRTARALDERLLSQERIHAQRTASLQTARTISHSRGVVPDWIGIMKELSTLMTEDAKILSLRSSRPEGTTVIVGIGEPRDSVDSIRADLIVALGTSPFFGRVHVIDASAADERRESRLELTLEVLAGFEEPGRSEP